MRATYGNRVPPVFRWSVAVLILVPLAALVGASFAGFVDEPAPVVVLTAIGVIVVCVYWRAGTLVRADPDAVRVSLPPFWTRRIPLATISARWRSSRSPISDENGGSGDPCAVTARCSSTPVNHGRAWPSTSVTAASSGSG